jgi:release factor glutamine methyltransferase
MMKEQEFLKFWCERNNIRGDENVTVGDITLMVRKNVFSPDPSMTHSSLLVLKHMPDVRGKSVVDLGTGTGILAIHAAKHGAASVTACDIDPDAIANAAENVAIHGLSSTVTVIESDLFSSVPQKYDVILAQLPIAPVAWEHLEHPVMSLYERFLAGLETHLAPGGIAVTVSASFGDVSKVTQLLEQSERKCTTLVESKFGVDWYLFTMI